MLCYSRVNSEETEGMLTMYQNVATEAPVMFGEKFAEIEQLYNNGVDFVAEWWGLAVVVLIAIAVWRFSRNRVGAVIPNNRRDPRRLFSQGDRKWITSNMLWGARCEHRSFFGLKRCRARGAMELDHWWPHARGGATTRDNLALLCTKHNKEKSHHTPTFLATFALNTARKKYMREYPGPIGRRYRKGMF